MKEIPSPTAEAGRLALQRLVKERNMMAALQAIHDTMGDLFALPLPGFNAVMMVGPEANRWLLTEERAQLRWRAEHDPVTRLLGHGVLVEDGETHDALRRALNPALHRRMLGGYVDAMVRATDQVMATWQDGQQIDMLVEMRKVALLILTETLFGEDFTPHLQPLWQSILRNIQYISPGLWLLWPAVPRLGYRRARRRVDAYLYQLIAARRAQMGTHQSIQGDAQGAVASDMLSGLIASGMDDTLIRDQLLTILIAGHDTSTALLAWTLHLLSIHPTAQAGVQGEIDNILNGRAPVIDNVGQLTYLDQVIKESLRLYPPIHLGSRIAATGLEFQGYAIPAGTRVLYSIYLSHRHQGYWNDPDRFDPDRFLPEATRQRPPYLYLPFGGGPRNCIGTAFAQVEAKVVLARLLQCVEVRDVGTHVRLHMGATLEPHPGVRVQVCKRTSLD
jgi:cytochrome P450